jgi:hypothetical protein
MILKKKIYNSFLLFLLVSCSTKTKVKPTILVGLDEKKIEKIRIGDIAEQANALGPLPPSGFKNNESPKKNSRNPVLSFHCHDALYRSLYCLDALEAIEKEQKIGIFSASGMSAIVLALYAKHKNKNKVQFRYFKLIKSLKGERIFYPRWFKKLNSFIQSEFRDIKIQQLKRILFLPFYDKLNDSYILTTSGNLSELLLKQFNHSPSDKLVSPIVGKAPFDIKALRASGADLSYSVSLGIEQLTLAQTDGFYFGNYGQYFSYLSQNQESPFIFYYKNKKPIDLIQDFYIEEKIPQEQTEQTALLIAEQIEEWKLENSN